MKINVLMTTILVLSIFGCNRPKRVDGVYRYHWGEKEGYQVWVVDGYRVRHKIYQEFLYGGNEQRYPFNPKGEIWIDHAISCEEFELTLAHELNERHLMAKFGWTYDKAHDSSLALEQVMRKKYAAVCESHERELPLVSPEDYNNRKEITGIADSIKLQNIYRLPLAEKNGIKVWIVDGFLVRKNIFPDFGFSGNDRVYHFIPKGEIWIDGQISCEETAYSIVAEQVEREQMVKGKPFGEAYETGIAAVLALRNSMEIRIKNHPPLQVPDSLNRESGIIDPAEK